MKILICDDEPLAVERLSRLVGQLGHEVVATAHHGLEVQPLIEQYRPDVILLDIQMPEMSGHEALAAIRKQPWGKDIPVIILTNLGEEEAPKGIRSLGIHSYIVKAELTPRQVVQRVKDALGQ